MELTNSTDEELSIADQFTREQEEVSKLELMQRLNDLGESIQKKIDEDIQWRATTGIEQEWEQAECAYQGQDDFNDIIKPATLGGPFTTKSTNTRTAPRSRVFLNITGPYVDAAAARIADMILPNDERNFELRPTPLQDGDESPELNALMEKLGPAPQPPAGFVGQPAPEQPPMQMDPMAQAAQQVAGPQAAPTEGMPAMPAGPVAQPAPPNLDAKANDAAKLATKQIEDWLIECQWHSEVRKVLEDSARIGTGVLKGPYPVERKARKVIKGEAGPEMVQVIKIAPASRRISLWDCFPAAGCGDSIQNGSRFSERDSISPRRLRELADNDDLGYIPEQIAKVLENKTDKTDKKTGARSDRRDSSTKDNYEIWYHYGMLDKDDLIAAGLPDTDLPNHLISIPAIITIVDGIVIKAALNPLDDGSFPYDFLPWKRMTGLPYGRGVGWLLLTPQRMINASARTMMENLGLASGPQMVVNRGIVRPADGIWQVTPRKIWEMVVDPTMPDKMPKAGDVFSVFNIPTMTDEFMKVIQFSQKLAEDVTGLPQLMQGSQGAAPDTVGGMTILNNNASTVLRRIARSVDSNLTEPQIRRYYEYLMEYGENDAAKEDLQIDARGSTALVERELSNHALIQMGGLVTNPAFGASPARWFEENLKAQKLDPKRIQLTDEEKQKLAQQQPPPDPALEIAKLNAQSRMQEAQLDAQARAQLAQINADADLKREEMRIASQHWIAEQDTNLSWQTALMQTALQKDITLEQAKKELFIATSKLNTQVQLSAHDRAAAQVTTPSFEPPQRARPGHAFEE